MDALTKLWEYVKSSNDFASARVKICEILKENRKESIGQLGAQLALKLRGTYDGEEPAVFFKHVYNGRSRLLHGALKFTGRRKRPTIQQIESANPYLQEFVLDLLAVESVSPEA